MDLSGYFARPSDPAALPPEERIVLAAIDCIAEFGLEGATVRVIASRAGLNAASVNYYFRTKDRLVEAALRAAWSHVTEDIDRILVAGDEPRVALGLATGFLVEGAWRYPRLIRAIIVEHPLLRLEAAAFLKGIFARLREGSGSRGDDGLASTLLIALAVLLGFATDAVSLVTGLDLAEAESRVRLSGDLAALLFGPFSPPSTKAP